MENQIVQDWAFCHAIINNKIIELNDLLCKEDHKININQVLQDGCTGLHISVSNGNLSMAKLLVIHGAYMRKKNADGNTCLHLAAGIGHRELVKLFLRGSRVNALNQKKLTPLHLAVQNDQLDIVLLLLDNKAEINAQCERGNTPLHYASGQNNLELMKCLLSHGADPNLVNNLKDSAFHQSFLLKNDAVTELFLSHGANIKLKNTYGENALHQAARYHEIHILRKLLELKMDCNEKNEYGATALNLVVRYNPNDESMILSMVRLLVNFDAKIDVADNRGKTPIYNAVRSETFEVVKYLWNLGANITGSNMYSPIFPAVLNQDLEMIRFLISHGANLNVTDDYGQGALHLAINWFEDPDCIEVIKLLLENGVNIDEAEKDGCTGLQMALDKCSLRVFDYLLEKGASIFTRNIYSQTPLWTAVNNGLFNAAKTLISLGADVNDENSDRCSILSIAVWNNDEDMVHLLLEHGAEANDKSAIFAAARSGCINLMEVLLSNGAVIDHGKASGYLVIIEAIKYRKPKMVQYLLDDGACVNFGWGESTPLYYAVTDLHDQNHAPHASSIENTQEIIKILIKHIARFLMMNSKVNDINMEVIGSYQCIADYLDICRQELMNMMNSKIYDFCTTTYFDILSKKHNSLVYCLRSDEVVTILKSGAYKKMFVTYADALESNYLRGLYRLGIMDVFQNILSETLGAVLPYEIIYMIVEYFSNKDLKIYLGK